MKATISALRIEFADLQSANDLGSLLQLTSQFELVMEFTPAARVQASVGLGDESSGLALIQAAALMMRLNLLGGQIGLDEMLEHLRRDLEEVLSASGVPADDSDDLDITVVRPSLYASWPRAGDRDQGDLKSDD